MTDEEVNLKKTNIIKMAHYISSVALPVVLLSKGEDYEPGQLQLTINGKNIDWDMSLTNLNNSVPSFLLLLSGLNGINKFNVDIMDGVKFTIGDTYFDLGIEESSSMNEDMFFLAISEAASACLSSDLKYDKDKGSLEVFPLILNCTVVMEYLGLKKNNSFTMGDIIKSEELDREGSPEMLDNR